MATSTKKHGKSSAVARDVTSRKKKQRKKKPIFKKTFYRVYFAAIGVAIIGIIVGCIYLNGVVADYERALPDHVAEDAFKIFEQRDFAAVYASDTARENIGQGDRDFYLQTLSDYTDGKEISYRMGFTNTEDEMVYGVYADNDKFAEFKLIPSGEVTPHGNRYWRFDSVESFIQAEKPIEEEPVEEEPPVEEETVEDTRIECRITVMKDYSVTVDGVTLDRGSVTRGDIPVIDPTLLPPDVEVPLMYEYTVRSETGSPDIVVTDKGGQRIELTKDGEYSWISPVPGNPEIKESCEKFVEQAAKTLAGYSTKDRKQSAMLAFCAAGSPARDSVKNFDNNWCTRHKSATFDNMVTSDYRMYGDNCFSVHVTFDYNVNFDGKNKKIYPTAYTFIYVKQKDAAKIYSFTLY